MRDDKELTSTVTAGSTWSNEEHGTATAIHHCLNYLAHDARHLGLGQTANLLEMAAQLALDEAKTRRARH
jgi:hypothetical protein